MEMSNYFKFISDSRTTNYSNAHKSLKYHIYNSLFENVSLDSLSNKEKETYLDAAIIFSRTYWCTQNLRFILKVLNFKTDEVSELIWKNAVFNSILSPFKHEFKKTVSMLLNDKKYVSYLSLAMDVLDTSNPKISDNTIEKMIETRIGRNKSLFIESMNLQNFDKSVLIYNFISPEHDIKTLELPQI